MELIKNYKNLIIGAIVALLVFWGLSKLPSLFGVQYASGPGGETLVNTPFGEVKTSSGGQEVTFGTEEGKTTISTTEGKLPANFPSGEVPVYPKAKVVSSTSSASPKATLFVIGWETNDSPALVSDFYQKQLKAKDFTLTNITQSGDDSIIYFEKSTGDKKLSGWVSVSPKSEEVNVTDISLWYEQAQQ